MTNLRPHTGFKTPETRFSPPHWTQESVKKLQAIALFTLYQARMIYFWGHLLLIPLTLLTAWLLSQHYQSQTWPSFYATFEVLVPPLASTFFIPLILKEKQQRTLVLVGTTHRSLQTMFAVRLLLTIFFLAVLGFVLGLGLQLAPMEPPFVPNVSNPMIERDFATWPAEYLGGPNGTVAILLTLGAPTLFLGGLGAFLAHLTADIRVGYLVVFAVWMFNRAATNMAEHTVLRHIYLFVRSVVLSAPESVLGEEWLIPKIVQLVLGILLLFFSWRILNKPDRFL